MPDRPKVAIVIIPEGSSLADQGHNFEPAVITVIIGVNNTVRWVNQDITFSTIKADNMSDQEFWNATNLDESSNLDQLLSPGETFEYTFTKPGQFGYHSEPHPHLHGTVIVLSG
jgi:plastocyanin